MKMQARAQSKKSVNCKQGPGEIKKNCKIVKLKAATKIIKSDINLYR